MEDFPYVRGEMTVSRVGFGSTIRFEKELSWIRAEYSSPTRLRPLNLYHIRNTLPHSSLLKKYPSKFGHSAFVSKVPRTMNTLNKHSIELGAYEVEQPKPIKQSYKPFNSSAAKRIETKFATPGPPTYPYHEKLHGYNYCIGFGKKRRIWPATAVFCSAQNNAKCAQCQKQPVGDYVHNFETKLSLCRRCFKSQYMSVTTCDTDATVRAYKIRELNEYKPVRYCDFYHKHSTDKVVSALITPKELNYKIRKENYLYLYQPMWFKTKPYKSLERKL